MRYIHSCTSDDGTPEFSGVGVWTPFWGPEAGVGVSGVDSFKESIPPKCRLLLGAHSAPFYCYHGVKALKYIKTNGKYAKLWQLFCEELILERS